MDIQFSESESILFFYLLFILTALVAGSGGYIKRRNFPIVGSVLLFASLILLAVPLGFRKVGIDHGVYVEWFERADYWLKEVYFLTPEPLFRTLVLIAKDGFNNFQVIYIVSAITYLVGVYIYLSKKNSIGYLSIFFMNVSLYMYMCGLARISIAIGIFSISYTVIDDKWKFFLLLLLAAMFHYTAVIGVMVWVAYRSKKNISMKSAAYLITGMVVLSYLINRFSSALPYVIYRYAEYVNPSFSLRNITSCAIIIPAIILWAMYRKSYSEIYAEEYRFFDNLVKMVTVLIIISMIYSGTFRLTFYFYPVIAKIYFDFSKVLYRTGQGVLSIVYKGLFTLIGIVYVYEVFLTSPFITHLIIPFEM